MTSTTVPVGIDDPINSAILTISEDRIQGYHREPFEEIARQSGVPLETVITRIQAMLESGTIRRTRQTLMSTNLARGSLVAWQVPEERLHDAFDYMFQQDPFSGHVVIRTADAATQGASYRLWTTLKVPQGYSMEKHCQYLASQTGATAFRLMPAKCLFVLGVGHTRRRNMEPGSKADQPAQPTNTDLVELTEEEWRVLVALKREFEVDEVRPDAWRPRADEAGVPLETFHRIAESLNERGVVGRFSTFLEHVKPTGDGQRVTRYNALFHWAVPAGRELEAGGEVGRHHIMTHAYWREGGPEFRNVNIMGVVHGTEKDRVLEHKAAIDAHLEACGIPVSYTNVFWGGRSEIKPSEIAPVAYREWCIANNLDPESMRDESAQA